MANRFLFALIVLFSFAEATAPRAGAFPVAADLLDDEDGVAIAIVMKLVSHPKHRGQLAGILCARCYKAGRATVVTYRTFTPNRTHG